VEVSASLSEAVLVWPLGEDLLVSGAGTLGKRRDQCIPGRGIPGSSGSRPPSDGTAYAQFSPSSARAVSLSGVSFARLLFVFDKNTPASPLPYRRPALSMPPGDRHRARTSLVLPQAQPTARTPPSRSQGSSRPQQPPGAGAAEGTTPSSSDGVRRSSAGSRCPGVLRCGRGQTGRCLETELVIDRSVITVHLHRSTASTDTLRIPWRDISHVGVLPPPSAAR